jgi:hypothetical protein
MELESQTESELGPKEKERMRRAFKKKFKMEDEDVRVAEGIAEVHRNMGHVQQRQKKPEEALSFKKLWICISRRLEVIIKRYG